MFYPKPEKPRKSAPRRGSPAYQKAKREVLMRDGVCFMAMIDWTHTCRDQYGTAHGNRDLDKMTAEHVKKDLKFGVRAKDTPAFMVTLCWYENLRPPSKETRAKMREYLRKRYPVEWEAT